jgi:hypothetical protein
MDAIDFNKFKNMNIKSNHYKEFNFFLNFLLNFRAFSEEVNQVLLIISARDKKIVS